MGAELGGSVDVSDPSMRVHTQVVQYPKFTKLLGKLFIVRIDVQRLIVTSVLISTTDMRSLCSWAPCLDRNGEEFEFVRSVH